jgi:hypothetical protein
MANTSTDELLARIKALEDKDKTQVTQQELHDLNAQVKALQNSVFNQDLQNAYEAFAQKYGIHSPGGMSFSVRRNN